MNKDIIEDLNNKIADILSDALASNSEARDTTEKFVLLSTVEIMRHVENALEAAYDKGRSEGYDVGYKAAMTGRW